MEVMKFNINPVRSSSGEGPAVLFIDRDGDTLEITQGSSEILLRTEGCEQLIVDSPDQLDAIAQNMMQAAAQWRQQAEK